MVSQYRVVSVVSHSSNLVLCIGKTLTCLLCYKFVQLHAFIMIMYIFICKFPGESGNIFIIAGAVIGGIIAMTIVIVLILVIIVCCCQQRRGMYVYICCVYVCVPICTYMRLCLCLCVCEYTSHAQPPCGEHSNTSLT